MKSDSRKSDRKLRGAVRLAWAVVLLLSACSMASAEAANPQSAESRQIGGPANPQSAESRQVGGPAAAQPANDEYRVYEAVLKLIDSIPKPDPHVAIYDRTLSSKCDISSNNPVFANGCTFLWVRPDTDEQVEQMLRQRFHGLDRSTWKHFKAANSSSITLHDPLSTPYKHRFVGAETPVDAAQQSSQQSSQQWDSPDMTVYFSRVGFNSKKNEALVYVLAFSYVGRTAATGDYLRFRLGPDKTWTVAGRVRYMHLDDDVFVRLNRSAVFSPVSAVKPRRGTRGIDHAYVE